MMGIRRYTGLLILALLLGCSRDNSPKVPQAVALSFPENNSECLTGIPQTANTSEVEFSWQSTQYAAIYELTVSQIGAGVIENLVTSTTRARVVLQKGTPYSWFVVARNSSGNDGPASSTWQFYNAGAALSYPPFPAQIQSPGSGAGLIPNVNGEIELEWSGADADNDLSGFEIYFGADETDLDLQATLSAGQTSLLVPVETETVYYWEVLSRDSEGNTSRSGIYSFRVF